MADKAWKAHERETARKLGSSRLLQKGRSVPDVASDRYTIECKYRKTFSIWTLFRDIERKYKKDGKPVILVLKEAGKKGQLVVMDLDEWIKIAGIEEVEL